MNFMTICIPKKFPNIKPKGQQLFVLHDRPTPFHLSFVFAHLPNFFKKSFTSDLCYISSCRLTLSHQLDVSVGHTSIFFCTIISLYLILLVVLLLYVFIAALCCAPWCFLVSFPFTLRSRYSTYSIPGEERR
ncbi:hypothetical protein F5879DRAFT_396325 [Lentinula edodes]|nr:hypothetical protein F5879DRAFT_396325 [Lentinula edodes]